MGKRFITYSQSSIAKARALRRRSTQAEIKLWTLVRNNRFGRKFRRQVPIGPHIVDFSCYSAKLVVELDGGQHYTAEGNEYDFHRDQFLSDHDLTVLRFSNKELFANQDGVMLRIWGMRMERDPLSNPLLLREGYGRIYL